jgi:hypothetical protein
VADISVGAAIGAGFGLIRRKPLTVMVWGLLQVIGLGLFLAAYAGFLLSFIPMAMSQPAQGGQPSSAEVGQFVGGMLMGEGLIFLAAIMLMIFRVVLCAGIWRAVLRPEAGAWAYLRVGRAELFILLLLVGVGFAANIIVLPLLPIMLISGGLAMAHQVAAAIILGVIGLLAMIAAVIYVELRFSLIGPMIVHDGKFHFVDAWRLTRGKVGSLFVVGLGLAAILMAAEFVVIALVAAIGAATLGLAAGGFDAFFNQPPLVVAEKLAPGLILYVLAAIPISGCGLAVFVAPWARAYLDLSPPAPDGTFA